MSSEAIKKAERDAQESVARFERALQHLHNEVNVGAERIETFGDRTSQKVGDYREKVTDLKEKANEYVAHPSKVFDYVISEVQSRSEDYLLTKRFEAEQYVNAKIVEAEKMLLDKSMALEDYVGKTARSAQLGLNEMLQESLNETQINVDEFIADIEMKIDHFAGGFRNQMEGTLGNLAGKSGSFWLSVFASGCIIGALLGKRLAQSPLSSQNRITEKYSKVA